MAIYPTTGPTFRPGRVFRTFSQDIESVGLAVLTFLSGGILMFFSCFIVTKLLQCYKARLRRKKRKALGHDDDDDDDFNAAFASGTMDFDEESVESDDTNPERPLERRSSARHV